MSESGQKRLDKHLPLFKREVFGPTLLDLVGDGEGRSIGATVPHRHHHLDQMTMAIAPSRLVHQRIGGLLDTVMGKAEFRRRQHDETRTRQWGGNLLQVFVGQAKRPCKDYLFCFRTDTGHRL